MTSSWLLGVAALGATLAIFGATASRAIGAVQAEALDRVPAEAPSALYVSNQPPLLASPLIKLPIGAIKPQGWLAHQLDLERNGMAGRLSEVSEWLKFDHNGWVDPTIAGGWEELPYWLKGYGDLGYVTNDPAIIAETKKWIDAMLATQEADGWFGPRSLKTSLDGNPDLWPHMLVLNIMQSYYEYSKDERVIPFMTKYFRWQMDCPTEKFMKGYWPVMRVSDNIESIHWLYNRTKEPWLLELATKVYDAGAKWDNPDKLPNWHGVNQSQGFRDPTVYGEQSKDPKQLAGANAAYEKIRAMYGDYPGGGWGADENCRPGYSDPRQGFETCSIVELMHSFEMLTKIDGDPVWADRNEEVAFNLLPAAMTADQRGLRYLTAANMAQADHENKAPGIQNGGTMLSYSPFAVYRCCQHNHAMGWPYYAEHLWLATADAGVCASLYAPSEVSAKVADGAEVKIVETTDYPWADAINFKISAANAAEFPLYFRIPGWCSAPTLKVNGELATLDGNGKGYLRVKRTWNDGDTVELTLPRQVEVKRWFKNSAGVSYGPINFSLQIGEKYTQYNKDDKWPEYDLTATTPWNYGLVLDQASLKVEPQSGASVNNPFTHDTAPLVIEATAKKIPNWTLDHRGLLNPLAESPIKSSEAEETVRLIPSGAARLRITAFPVIGDGADARDWPEGPKLAFATAASHVYGSDSTEAVADGIEPKNSADGSIPRFTWWDHRGTNEWIEARFKEAKTVSSVSVYWFNDTTTGGHCDLPASWTLQYRSGDTWKIVEATGAFGTKPDEYNKVEFKPVATTALRIQAKLKNGASGGILEWKVE